MADERYRKFRRYDSEEDAESDEDVEKREEYESKFEAQKYATVFVIDNTDPMHEIIEEDEDENSYFKMCLLSILDALHKRLFQKHHFNFALILLTSRQPIIELSYGLKQSLVILNELSQKTNKELKDLYCNPTTGQCIHEALHDGVTYFKKSEKLLKNSYKHVAVLTNNPEPPHCQDSDQCQFVLDELKIFKIELVILPLISDFDWKKYYYDLMKRSAISDFDLSPDDLTTEEIQYYDLSMTVYNLTRGNTHVKRTCLRIFPELDMFLHVQVRKLCDVLKLYRNVHVDDCTGDAVIPFVRRKEIVSQLTKEQRDTIEKVKLPYGLSLICIGPSSMNMHYLKKRMFLIEQDEVASGSIDQLFDYVWDYCKTNDLALYCYYFRGFHREKNKKVQLVPKRLLLRLLF